MANSRLGELTQWSIKRTKKNLAVVAVCLILIIFSCSLLPDSSPSSIKHTDPLTLHSDYVDLTLLRNAKHKGAFCLDGSLPGYHFKKGFGSGSNNWLLHIEGGGWCDTIASCSLRKATALGSSDHMERQVLFSGILSNDPMQNPDFYTWNKVKIRYCDGASFSGHPESEFHNGTNLFFRGQLIWEALMEELLSLGLSNAKQALLSGCSAGGLATMIHCDDFGELLPKDTTVKCLADASFFLDEKDVSGMLTMRSFYQNVVQLQGLAKSLPKDCVAKMKSSECLFPKEIIKSIKTPFFLVNPAYDSWQILNVLAPAASDPHGNWLRCKNNIHNCNPSEMVILQGFRNSLLNALSDFEKNKEWGMFINSCFIHCQTWLTETWHGPNSPKIDNKSIAESVGDWYFDRETVKRIDCPFPCNPSCFNQNLA
ncbi:hypothetical protein Nepgr_024931 [Nepenthes gracilis]|uniref:Pectin acetylesterase n=1 Tax=Nepenthes gracilis TaxID=150966 RepID=A0AAD3T3T5_NEPGR|nr:hypothetical protein Nepgr_024931 [Nepenthes gracilis]